MAARFPPPPISRLPPLSSLAPSVSNRYPSIPPSYSNRTPVSTRQLSSQSPPVSLYYANARSIRCKTPQLSFLLSSSQFRVICITETWLDSSDCDSLLVGGYSDFLPFRCDRVVNDDYGRGGGVACIVHNSLSPILVSSFSSSQLESCVVDLNLIYCSSFPYRKIRLILVYRSPSAPNNSMIALLEFLESQMSDNFPCVLLGDFNLPSIDWLSLSSPVPNDFLDFVSFHRFNQYVTFPSRLNNYLDLVFCNKDVINSIAPSTPLSDHLSITFDLSIPSPPPGTFTPTRLFRLADWTSISNCIYDHNWTLALRNLDAHESYEYFVVFIKHLLDSFVPFSKPSLHSRYPRNVKILYNKSTHLSRTAPNSVACLKMTRRFTVALNRFHCSLENRIVASSNSKLFYSYCNEKLKSPKTTPSGILDSDGTFLMSSIQKCIAFDKYFCSVFSKPQHSPLQPPSSFHEFDLPSISQQDVMYALSKLAPKVNVTPDSIPSIVLSKSSYHL